MKPRCIELTLPTRPFSGIMLLGEAPGRDEEIKGKPFVGKSGKLLDGWLTKSRIDRRTIIISNIFHIRPDNNKIALFFVSFNEALSGAKICTRVAKRGSTYLKPEYYKEIRRLRHEIKKYKPVVIVTLGAVALWGCTGQNSIGPLIGEKLVAEQLRSKVPVFPAYHPSFLLRGADKKYEKLSIQALKRARKFAKAQIPF